MLLFSPLHSQSRSSFLARLYSTHWIFSPNRSSWLGCIHVHIFCSQAFAAKLACAKDGWGSPIAGMGGAGAGGVVSQSSGSGSNSAREWSSSRAMLRSFCSFRRWIPVQLQYRQKPLFGTCHTSLCAQIYCNHERALLAASKLHGHAHHERYWPISSELHFPQFCTFL